MQRALLALALTATGALAAAGEPLLDLTPAILSEIAAEEQRRSHESERYPCFREAYNEVATEGCRRLDDEGKMRLAFGFAACQLSVTGRPHVACPADAPVAACGAQLDAAQYAEFSNWLRHVDTLCFALESRSWRQDTSATIVRLLRGADATATLLSQLSDASLLAYSRFENMTEESARLAGRVHDMQVGRRRD
jgi:hypothetical protein